MSDDDLDNILDDALEEFDDDSFVQESLASVQRQQEEQQQQQQQQQQQEKQSTPQIEEVEEGDDDEEEAAAPETSAPEMSPQDAAQFNEALKMLLGQMDQLANEDLGVDNPEAAGALQQQLQALVQEMQKEHSHLEAAMPDAASAQAASGGGKKGKTKKKKKKKGNKKNKQKSAGADAAAPSASAADPATNPPSERELLDEMLRQMSNTADPALDASGLDDDLISQMFADFQNEQDGLPNMPNLPPFGEGGDMDSLMREVMGQLMSKEFLMEPFQDLCEKYPPFLEENRDTLSPEEYARFENQLLKIREIVAFLKGLPEGAASAEASEELQTMIDALQEYGQPPEAVIQDLAPGGPLPFGAPGEGMPPLPPGMDKACSIM